MLSCDKEVEQAGIEIQPDENRLKVSYVELDGFVSSSSRADYINTNYQNSSNLLGSIDETIFGKTTAFFVSQFRLSSDNVEFGNEPKLVSAKLVLDIIGYEGDTAQSLNFKIFESTFPLIKNSDTLYRSNLDLSTFEGVNCADVSIVTNISDNLKLSLSSEFGQKILDTKKDTLVNNEIFLEKFKGLYFKVDSNVSDPGLIWKFDMNSESSYILLEYTSEDADGDVILDENSDTIVNEFKLQFNNECARFNQYFNNTNSLNTIFGQSSDKVYISGTAGVKGHINLDPILNWRDSSGLMIYKAELLAKATLIDGINWPERLLLEIDDADDDVDFVDDDSVANLDNYGGTYDSETENYSMVITRHIQNIVNKNHDNTKLWITPYANKTNPSRIILSNGANDEKIRLKITYSNLN